VGPRIDFAREVSIEFGEGKAHADGLAYSMRWRVIGAVGLFPRLSADLLVSPMGKELTRLTFDGNYDPPLGSLGRAIDRLLLGRFADAIVKNWVDRLATALKSDQIGISTSTEVPTPHSERI
jgi:hypothetical protein